MKRVYVEEIPGNAQKLAKLRAIEADRDEAVELLRRVYALLSQVPLERIEYFIRLLDAEAE